MNKSKKYTTYVTKYHVIILTFFSGLSVAQQLDTPNSFEQKNALSFEVAIKSAQKNDPWLVGNIHQQKSIESLSTAVNSLPDPTVSIGLANLPTNGFDFNQEGMTQAKIGIAQRFPRGETLAIKSQQLKMESQAYPFQRKDREAKIAVTVGSLWLDVYRVQQSMVLIEKKRSLFEQLVEVTEASYSSAFGKTRQQDIVRAQLELTRLEERLILLSLQKNNYEGQLLQWLSQFNEQGTQDDNLDVWAELALNDLVLTEKLPQIALINKAVIDDKQWLKPQVLVRYFANHPSVVAIDNKVKATQVGISLAKQKYQPEWGVNASYGYRDDDPMGNSRADFFSVGVTFDLPLFTENRQDQEMQSAIYKTESVKTEKHLLLRQLLGSYASAKGRLIRLKERQNLYSTTLLPQIHDQAEASLTAYTNDDGDFSEVVRARIAELNAEIDELTLNVEEQKIRLELHYLFVGSHGSNITSASNRYTQEMNNEYGE